MFGTSKVFAFTKCFTILNNVHAFKKMLAISNINLKKMFEFYNKLSEKQIIRIQKIFMFSNDQKII